MKQPKGHVRVAIIGSGFAGLGMAMRLRARGEKDFLIFERADELGGVWRDNSYPNCACDVESHLYSFSFAPNAGWTHAFSRQPEILVYLQRCAKEHDLEPHLRFRHEVVRAEWSEEALHWILETRAGTYTAEALVSATGGLSDPQMPAIDGLETFAGTAFHSARWNHDFDLTGKRVAVVGTGASAIQFIPAIAPQVKELTVFQRTPPWVMPRNDREFSAAEKGIFRAFAPSQLALRGGIYAFRELLATSFLYPRASRLLKSLAKHHLRRKVKDPELRKKLTPSYDVGCKRILISDDYFPAITRENVSVVTESIREIKPNAIVTRDGIEHTVDAIIFGTGFKVQEMPILTRVFGRFGKSLRETWETTMTAHLGTTVFGFPNLFILQGPNTGLGHTSVITMIESQVEHVLSALDLMKKKDAWIEPTEEAQAAFVREVDEKMRGTVWTTGGCQSWYLDKGGRNSTIWPGFTFTFKRRLEQFREEEYRATPKDSTAHASTKEGSEPKSGAEDNPLRGAP